LIPAIFNDTNGIIDSPDPFIQKIPYFKAAMFVKRINAFRIGDPGRGAALFDPHSGAPGHNVGTICVGSRYSSDIIGNLTAKPTKACNQGYTAICQKAIIPKLPNEAIPYCRLFHQDIGNRHRINW
jgi:hypothetical protein